MDVETQERDIDKVIRQVHQCMPEVEVTQLPIKRPSDNDNLWWFSLPEVKQDIQVEGSCCPFLLESDEQCCKHALKATTTNEAVDMILTYLQSVKSNQPVRLVGELYWQP